jgi:hypothetical protein
MLDRELCVTRGVAFVVNQFSTSDDYDREQEEFYQRTFFTERLKDVSLEGCYQKQSRAPGWCTIYGPLRRIVEICYDDGEIPKEVARINDEDDPWTSVQNIVQGPDLIYPMDIDNAPSGALELANVDWDIKCEIEDMPACILQWNHVYPREARAYQEMRNEANEEDYPLLMALILTLSPYLHERAEDAVEFLQRTKRDSLIESINIRELF